MYVVLTWVFGILCVIFAAAILYVYAWQQSRVTRYFKAFMLSSNALSYISKKYSGVVDVDAAIAAAKLDLQKELDNGKRI